jgi:endo-1,4-beta-mannosidase
MSLFDRFILGINYWPRDTAMYWWREFDRTAVQREFSQMAELGAEVIRRCLMSWNRCWISPKRPAWM